MYTKGKLKAVDCEEMFATYLELGEIDNMAVILWSAFNSLDVEEKKSFAKELVKRWNSHEALVEALDNALMYIMGECIDVDNINYKDIKEHLQQALKQAKGE